MARGDVLLVNLPASRRREQSGRRPFADFILLNHMMP